MLELRGIKKDYPAGDGTVHALKGIDLQFRESEFVAILGPSGCGKTTMLNIIGGLDGYTDGDLIINGVSTKRFKDRDWDTYRNHSVGFVFQSYNLIPHQTVLQNVELALTLSGVSKAERRARAKKALEEVGLGDQLSKKPNEMSGGQMQRVAIARALVNNPDIILADEPTGALDTETSVQVMDILKEVAKDRLVVMVTHNPDLAEQYASRIIRVLDGRLISDSNPLSAEELAAANAEFERLQKEGRKEPRKPSMSFRTSFMLSLKNLFTKKGRTILTAFAGSIGIFGIALILSLSTGINDYIDQVQQETLASYPITIESESVDMSTMITSLMGDASSSETEEHEEGRVYTSHIMYQMLDSMLNMETTSNNLEAFKEYLDNGGGGISDLATIQYSYDLD
ncbi:MAG: ABC transporter ATP-binding protein, partial [Oscillospiraceae bacterium]